MAVIGIAVLAERMECAVVRPRARAIAWCASGSVDPRDLAGSVARLLDGLPESARRVRAHIALDAAWCQLRHLRELPPLKDVLMRRAIAESRSRFFLRSRSPLVTTGVRHTSATEGWAAAFDGELIDQLVAACASHDVRLDTVVPLACLPSDAADALPCPLARAAACVQRDAPLTYAPSHSPRQASRAATVAAAATLVVSISAFAFAPGVGAAYVRSSAGTVMSETAAGGASTRDETIVLGRIQARARAIRAFAGSVRSHTLLIADFARLLPADAFLISLRCDASGGVAVIVAANVDDAVRAVAAVRGVASPRIAGSVTREAVGTDARQRFTVSFSWTRGDGAR